MVLFHWFGSFVNFQADLLKRFHWLGVFESFCYQKFAPNRAAFHSVQVYFLVQVSLAYVSPKTLATAAFLAPAGERMH